MNIYIFNPVTTLNLLETPVGAIAIQSIHTSSMSFDPTLHPHEMPKIWVV